MTCWRNVSLLASHTNNLDLYVSNFLNIWKITQIKILYTVEVSFGMEASFVFAQDANSVEINS